MNVLITGGAGFIASHVTDAYVAAGHQVTVLDNLSTGKQEFVNPQATFVQADITDKETIQKIIRDLKPEVINHHAAHIQVGNSVRNPQFDAENNILAILHIMEAAKDIPIKKIIMASTGGAMYGNKPIPFTEELKEEPLSPYGVSKRSGELYLNYYHEQYGIPYVALRYANVYGPRQNPHGESGVVAIFSELMLQQKPATINGPGTNTRDYVYVGDVAKANMAALDTDYVGALNIGTGVATSTNQVFQKINQLLGNTFEETHGPARPGEQTESVLSAAKAKQILGWEPTVNFDQGIQEVVNWYKSHQA